MTFSYSRRCWSFFDQALIGFGMDCEAALGGAFDAILKTAPQFHFDTQLEQSFARGGDRAAKVDPYTIIFAQWAEWAGLRSAARRGSPLQSCTLRWCDTRPR
jgi:hypothetical protein